MLFQDNHWEREATPITAAERQGAEKGSELFLKRKRGQNCFWWVRQRGVGDSVVEHGVTGGNAVAEKEIDIAYNSDDSISSLSRYLDGQLVVTADYT